MLRGTDSQGRVRGQGRVDGHHLRVHGEARIGVMAAAAVSRDGLDGLELGTVLFELQLGRVRVLVGQPRLIEGEDGLGQNA